MHDKTREQDGFGIGVLETLALNMADPLRKE